MRKAEWSVLVLAVVLLGGVWLRVVNPTAPTRSPDENYYMFYAEKVAAAPLSTPRELVAVYNKTPATWTYPIPLRIGYYYSISAIMKVFGVGPEKAGLGLSTGCSIVQLLLVAIVGVRFLNKWAAVIAVALLSVSPMDLELARRVWGDGVSGCVAMMLVWICAEICTRPRARLWYAGLWICSAYFLLVKETGGVFFGLCVVGLAVASWRRSGSWREVGWIGLGAVGTAVCSFTIMAVMCGGVSAALETVRHSAQAAPLNQYGKTFQTGPWYSLPLGMWMLSPLAGCGCAVGVAAIAVARESVRETLGMGRRPMEVLVGMAAVMVLVIAVSSVPPALMNLRYVSFVYGMWYLMAGVGVSFLGRKIEGRLRGWAVGAVMVLVMGYSCWGDYSRFREMFLQGGVRDLDIRQVVGFPFGERT